MGFPVGDQVDFMLPLLGLKAVLGSAVVADTAAAQDDDDGPHQPEPPEFIVVVAALRLSTAVSCVTDVALIVGTHVDYTELFISINFFPLKKIVIYHDEDDNAKTRSLAHHLG